MFDWELAAAARRSSTSSSRNFFAADRRHGDYLHVFDYQGRRVTRRDLEFETFRPMAGGAEAAAGRPIAFFYGNFVHGVRRCVIDGVEPADRPSDSIQFDLFEYIYHQILRKDPDWVARDLFRQLYRENADAVAAAHSTIEQQLACLLLYTSHEAMLDDLISPPAGRRRRAVQRQHDHLPGQGPRRQPARRAASTSPNTAAARAAIRSCRLRSTNGD